MIELKDTITIAAAPEEVFALLARPELMTPHLDSVKELKVISRDAQALLAEMVVAANGRDSHLILETRFFPPGRVEMRQLKGELRRLEIIDRLAAERQGTRVTETVAFDIGLPLLGGLLGGLGLKQKMARQLQERLSLLKRLVEQGVPGSSDLADPPPGTVTRPASGG